LLYAESLRQERAKDRDLLLEGALARGVTRQGQRFLVRLDELSDDRRRNFLRRAARAPGLRCLDLPERDTEDLLLDRVAGLESLGHPSFDFFEQHTFTRLPM